MNLITETLATEHRFDKHFLSDLQFDKLLPLELRYHSARHWTPVDVAYKAAKFLADASRDAYTLDVGAGIGKFCAVAGHFTKSKVMGIEQRPELVSVGNKLLDRLRISNVELRVENMTQTKFDDYTGIYFFNSFYENIDTYSSPIDNTIEYSSSLFRYYTDLLFKKLNEMPVYTRLATYHTILSHIPENYTVLESHFSGNLKLWIKYA